MIIAYIIGVVFLIALGAWGMTRYERSAAAKRVAAVGAKLGADVSALVKAVKKKP